MPSQLERLKVKYQYLRSHPAFRTAPFATTLRLAGWWGHCALGMPGSAMLAGCDAKLDLPPLWRGVAKLLYAFRDGYEPELRYMAATLSPGMTVVDVGACYGVYTTVAGRAVGDSGLVLAFEPAEAAYAVLDHHVQLNGLGNVRLFRCALSDKAGEARLHHHPDPSRNSLAADGCSPSSWEDVSVSTLDGVLEAQGVDHVDLLKIDAEGAEELILTGARSLLSRSRPTVIFEVNPAAARSFGLSKGAAWDILEKLGYRFFSVRGGLEPVRLDEPADGGNVVALHGGSL